MREKNLNPIRSCLKIHAGFVKEEITGGVDLWFMMWRLLVLDRVGM